MSNAKHSSANLHSNLEVAHSYSDLEPAMPVEVYPEQASHVYVWANALNGDAGVAARPENSRVCGFRRRTFVLLVAAAVVIIASVALGSGLTN
jgi:hypothetical protein